MSIQAAGGTTIYTTYAADDRTTLVDNLKAEMVNAGWSVASGSSGDWKLDSATTSAGHSVRARLRDPGSGNCAQITIMNAAETITPAGVAYLLPGAGKSYIVVANKYQVFTFTPSPSAAREFAAFGVLSVPAHVSTSNAAWMICNSHNDTNTTVLNAFRNSMMCDVGSNVNTTIIFGNASWTSTTPGAGSPRLEAHVGGNSRAFYRWHDGSSDIHDAIFGCGATANSDECKKVGQLWDAFIGTDSWAGDSLVTYDSRQYIAVTHNNTGTNHGTLFVYAPPA